MSKKKNFSSVSQINTVPKKQNKSNIKSYIITEDQIRDLYFEITSSNAIEYKLIKVKNYLEFLYEFDDAQDYYMNSEDVDFKKEYEDLENSCKDGEIVVFEYIPFSFQQMLDSVNDKINIYCQENEDAYFSGIDAELDNLILLRDIIEQNI